MNANKKKQPHYWKAIWQKLQVNLSLKYSQREQLSDVLQHFYLDIRTKGWNLYKASMLSTIGFGLTTHRYLKSSTYNKKFDIIKDSQSVMQMRILSQQLWRN
jgi:hypothetical protein